MFGECLVLGHGNAPNGRGLPGRAGPATKSNKPLKARLSGAGNWLRGVDLNHRPSGYEPDELPGCSTPRFVVAKSKRCTPGLTSGFPAMFWKGAPFSFWTGWLDGFGVRAGAGARGARRCSDTSGPRPRPDSKTARSTGTGTLILRAGRLHRPAAQRFVAPLCIPLVHPRLVLPQIGPFPGHRFPRGAALRQFTLQFLQPPDHLHRRFVLHRPLQRFPPRRQRCAVLPKTRPGHRCQFLHRGRRPVLSPSPSATVGQTTPLSAAATPAAGAPPGDRSEAGANSALVAVGQAGQRLMAGRAAGRGALALAWAAASPVRRGSSRVGRRTSASRGPRFGSRAATNSWGAASRFTARCAATTGSKVGLSGRPREQTGANRQVVFVPSFYQLPPRLRPLKN